MMVPLRILVIPNLFSLEELHMLDAGSERLDALVPSIKSDKASKASTYGSFEEEGRAKPT